jgi:hypothetical protein
MTSYMFRPTMLQFSERYIKKVQYIRAKIKLQKFQNQSRGTKQVIKAMV